MKWSVEGSAVVCTERGVTIGKYAAITFVDSAISEFKKGDNRKLMIAIKLDLPELWQSDDLKRLVKHIVSGEVSVQTGSLKQHGRPTELERDAKIYQRMNYWIGQGLNKTKNHPDPEETAKAKVALEFKDDDDLNEETVYNIYLKQKKQDPSGIVASIYQNSKAVDQD